MFYILFIFSTLLARIFEIVLNHTSDRDFFSLPSLNSNTKKYFIGKHDVKCGLRDVNN